VATGEKSLRCRRQMAHPNSVKHFMLVQMQCACSLPISVSLFLVPPDDGLLCYGAPPRQGWCIMYPDGLSELHPVVERVGGCRIYFGDSSDVRRSTGLAAAMEGPQVANPVRPRTKCGPLSTNIGFPPCAWEQRSNGCISPPT
jgi:hypothetical protein